MGNVGSNGDRFAGRIVLVFDVGEGDVQEVILARWQAIDHRA